MGLDTLLAAAFDLYSGDEIWLGGALGCGAAMAQDGLHERLRAIAADAQGKVAIACQLPGLTLDCGLNEHSRPPMQSVFKLPLGIAVLAEVDRGRLRLDQPVRFLPSDRILPHTYSPLQDKYPEAGVDVPLQELLRLSVSLSDNAATDVLVRLLGGWRRIRGLCRAIQYADSRDQRRRSQVPEES